MRIYIIGPVGSGKTTLAGKLSKMLNIKHYELDEVTWKHSSNGIDIKSSLKEVNDIFNKIINSSDWIIENVGKDIYAEAYLKADKIIYINLKEKTLYRRIIIRWFKQRLHLYKSNYKPSIKNLKQMLIWANNEKKYSKINQLNMYKNKLLIIDEKQLDNVANLCQLLLF